MERSSPGSTSARRRRVRSSPPPAPDASLEIIGIGEAPSTGMRKGVVTDLEETVRAIEAATEKAERMAGVHISHVYVGVTGEHITVDQQSRRRSGVG